jgi:hypothetical protein
VAEVIAELVSTAFYFFENMFDSVPISASDMVKSEAVTMAGCLELWSAIEKKRCVLDLMFLLEFRVKHPGNF